MTAKQTGDGASHLDEAMASIQDMIDRHGWAAVAVGGDGEDNPFAYTVGLAKDHGIELVIVGLAGEQAHSVLTAAIEAVRDGLDLPADGTSVTSNDIIAGSPAAGRHSVRFDRIPDRNTVPVNVAHKLQPDGDWTLWQIIWPDAAGRLPDHPDYDLGLLRAQVLPVR